MTKSALYFEPALSVDAVIFTIEDADLKVLLIRREMEPFKGTRALPGGFLKKNETTREAALRILKDKAGVTNVYVEQLYTFDAMGRDPRGHVVTVASFALVPRERIAITPGSHTQHPELVSVRHLEKLAFDHAAIIKYAVTRLQAKVGYTNVVYSLLPEYFTLSQLQKTYEIILGAAFDKRNFIKKFMSLGLIKKTTRMLKGERQRPARLYTFASKKPAELKKFF